jgi:hypothetical protein
MGIPSVAHLRHETAEHHDPYEKSHAPHNWWDWYAAYMKARERGSSPDDAWLLRVATWRRPCTSPRFELVAGRCQTRSRRATDGPGAGRWLSAAKSGPRPKRVITDR